MQSPINFNKTPDKYTIKSHRGKKEKLTSAEIEEQTREYLSKGYKIDRIEPDEYLYNKAIPDVSPAHELR